MDSRVMVYMNCVGDHLAIILSKYVSCFFCLVVLCPSQQLKSS